MAIGYLFEPIGHKSVQLTLSLGSGLMAFRTFPRQDCILCSRQQGGMGQALTSDLPLVLKGGIMGAVFDTLLSPSTRGQQQLLNKMQSFCLANELTSVPKTKVVVFDGGHLQCQWHVGAIASSVVNRSSIWAGCSTRTDTSSMHFSMAQLGPLRPKGPSSHVTRGLAVPILSSSLHGCSRQFCSPVLSVHVRFGLRPQLALSLSESLSSSRGRFSAERAKSISEHLC